MRKTIKNRIADKRYFKRTAKKTKVYNVIHRSGKRL